MSSRKSFLRHVALMFAAHAKRTLLKKNAFWADGMEQEAHHIQNDWSAVQWAFGCVVASYVETAKAAGFLAGTIRFFLAALILYLSCENFLVPVQSLLCYLQFSKSASQLLVFFPIERIMCVPWPAIPATMQVASVIAGALYVISALVLIRNGAASIRWFITAFLIGSIALLAERGLPETSIYRYAVSYEHALLSIIVGRAVFPILVATAVWLNSATCIRADSGPTAGV